ncbi:MAG: hypothetical protein LBS21_08965 [Clostridiales bacterium]|jgi:hypothetical protein|nr:hypothetical protein [Clostridiales bacterium]
MKIAASSGMYENAQISGRAVQSLQKNRKTEEKDKKNTSINMAENIDELIKNLQESIEAIKVNEKYDDKTKETKIEAIQQQIDELNELKAAQQFEEMQKRLDEMKEKHKKEQKEEYTDINKHGDMLFLSDEETKLLANIHNSFEGISYISQIKAKLTAEAHYHKTEKISESIAKLEAAEKAAIGKVFKDVEDFVEEKAENTESRRIETQQEEKEDETSITRQDEN